MKESTSHKASAKMMHSSTVTLLLISFIGLVSADVKSQCLQCLCKTTNCMVDIGKCKTENVDSKSIALCGPYKLSESYWIAAGKPEEDYRSCTTRLQCSEKTIRSYMELNSKSCGVAQLTCEQFIRVHYGGAASCQVGSPQHTATTDAWNKAKQTCGM